MYVLFVTIFVKPDFVNSFIEATTKYAEITRSEIGNNRYELFRSEDDPNCFVIYEEYQSKDGFLFHRETEHAVKWKDVVEEMMAAPRDRIRCHKIA